MERGKGKLQTGPGAGTGGRGCFAEGSQGRSFIRCHSRSEPNEGGYEPCDNPWEHSPVQAKDSPQAEDLRSALGV